MSDAPVKAESEKQEPIRAEIWIEEGKIRVRLFDGRVFELTKPLNTVGRPEGMIGFLRELLSRYMQDAMILAGLFPTLRSYGNPEVPR